MNLRIGFTSWARRLSAAILLVGLTGLAQAQVSGTKNIPGDYPDLAAAIADVNAIGVGAGGATLNVVAGNPQVAPIAGYVIATTTTSVANPLAIVGNANTLTANPALTVGAINDAIVKIVGTDNVTISGFTIQENVANTTTATLTNNMVEFGIALAYATPTDNAQNITIQNNTITLNRASNNTFGIYANATHTAAVVTTTASGTGAAGGNSGLKIYSNIINNVNNAIAVIGPTAAADANDGVDIGGASAATGNTITNYGSTGTFSSFANVAVATVNGVLIRNTKNFNVSFNTITSSTSAIIPTATNSGTVRGVYVPGFSAAPLGTIANSINNNAIGMRGGATSVILRGIDVETTTGNITTTVNINNNNFADASWNPAASSGATTFISNLGVVLNANINNNTFTNLTVNSTGGVTFITNGFSLPAGGTKNVNGNSIVTAFSKTGVGGTIALYVDNASSVAGSFVNNNNNNFSNITVTGTTGQTGWANTDGASAANAPTKSVTGNTFSNWTNGGSTSSIAGLTVSFSGTGTVSNNLISNFTGGGTVTGLVTASGASTTLIQNTIHTLTSSGANNVTGINAASGTTVNIAQNKVYNLTGNNASSAVFGITVGGGTTANVFNNIVGDLFLPASGATNSLAGLNFTGGATVNASFNTVRLAATSSGANFGSAAVSVSSTPTVNLRNNNFVNLSTPAGTGFTVAYRRSSTTLTTYGAVSNNNNFYAGTPGAANVIFFDGTNNDQTLAAFKVRVAARDSSSVTENPTFASTTGSAATFLHINTAIATQLESNGIAVSGITDDFDSEVRNVTTPDIGADEFNGILLDLNGPLITYTALPNTTLFTNRTLLVTITDPSLVAGGGNAPRVYFRKNAGSYFSMGCTGASPNFTCVIDNALLGGVTTGDVVNYFVIAQDVPGNVSANPGVGLVAANVNTVTTPPTTPATYNVVAPFPNSVNVGTAETITSLTNAGGLFAQLNAGVITGNVIVNITSDLAGETGANALNLLSEQPAGSNFTLKISPAGSARVITGAFNGALIRLNGASRVTLDGSIGGTGTDRSLTIQNTSVTTPNVVLIGSVGTTPITNSTLKNCIVINGVNTSSAVVISDATTVGAAGIFSNITIQNNDVQKAFVGVFATGGTTPANGSNLVYTQNTLNTVGANAIRNVGLYMQGVSGATVSQNTVGNFSNVEGENDTGIWLATGTGNATVSGNTVSNLSMTLTTAFAPFGMRESSGLVAAGTNFTGNTVTNLSTTGNAALRGISVGSGGVTISSNKVQGVINNNVTTFGAYGIDVSAGNNNVIQNNFVSDVNHNMTGGGAFDEVFGVVGIRLGAGTGHKVYFNSVNLFGLHPGTANTNLLSTAFSISSTAQTGIDVRNNIFANNITGGTTSIAHVSVFLPTAATVAMNLTMNNNAYYFGTDVARQGAGQAGILAGTNFFTTLPLLAAYTSPLSVAATNDNASIAPITAVPFTSNTDLHVAVASAVVNVGTPIAGVTTDIDNDPRSAPAPEIGADELVDPNTAPTITPAVGVARQQGTAVSNSTIATVSDLEQTAGSLVVTAPTVPAGLTVSTIVNTTGTVTANLVAACTATLGANTVGLSVSDGFLSTAGNLSVNVTANTAPVQGTYSAAIVTTGSGTTLTPSAAPTDNGSVTSVTASAPGFTGTFSGNPTTGVVTISTAGPAGVYTVTVTATDNCGATSTRTFQLTVNSAPTITPVAGLTRQAGSAVSNSTIATVTDDAGNGTVVVTSSGPANGFTLSNIVNTNGTVTADLIASCSATNSIFTLTATDTGGLTATGDIFPAVIANTAPTQGTYANTSLISGAGTTVTPSAAPTDNGSITTITAAAPGFTGTFSVNTGTGVVTIASAGPGGTFTVTVTATDNCGTTSTSTFQLTVNTAPTLTPGAAISRQQGSAATSANVGTAADAETAAGSLTVTAIAGGTATGITVGAITNSAGAISAPIAASCTAATGTQRFQVSDGSLTGTSDLTVNVTANSAPVLGTYGTTAATTGGSTSVTPSAAPSDNGSVASVTAAAPGFTGTLTGNASTGVISVGTAGPAGSYTVTVTATDNCGLTSTTTFTLNVSNANTAPTITPLNGQTRQQGTLTANNSIIANVADAESSAGSLVVTAPTVPAGLTVNTIVNTNGSVTANVIAACTATLGANTVGLSVSDGSLSTAGSLGLTVTANTPPTLGGNYTNATVLVGGSTSIVDGGFFENGTVATLTASAPGFTGTFVGNPSTFAIAVSNAGPAGVYVVTVVATDNCGASTNTTVQLTVNAANTPPTLTPATAITRQQGSAATSANVGTAADAQTAAGSLTVTSIAGGTATGITVGAITNTAGAITAPIAASCTAVTGTQRFQVSDGSLTGTGDLQVNVTANTAPVQGTYAATTVATAAGTTVTPSAAPTDNGTITTVTAAAPGFTGTLSVNSTTGVVTVGAAAPAGVFTVTVTATDNCGATSTSTFQLTVAGADLAIVKTSSVNLLNSGLMQYTLLVSNTGPSAVTGATVADTFAATLTNAAWTCVGVGGGTCTANGSGNISQLVNLPNGASVVFSITATVVQPLPGTLSNTATVTAPVGTPDPTPGNNSSTVNDVILLFRNGFEDVVPFAPMVLNASSSVQSLALPLASISAMATDYKAAEVIRFEISGQLVVLQARRIDGALQSRLLTQEKDGRWTVGDWTTVSSNTLSLEWSSVGANVQVRLKQ
jgi:trimeric autotransporter adhesin